MHAEVGLGHARYGAAELFGGGLKVDAGRVGEAEGVDLVPDLCGEGEEGKDLLLGERAR